MSMSKLVKSIKESDTEALVEMLVKSKFEKIFVKGYEKFEVRKGLHASAMIKADAEFCYREQVLSLLYVQNQGQKFPYQTQNCFYTGDDIHEKWQKMFVKAGVAEGIERRRYSKKFDFYLTPDGELHFIFKDFLLEIKSCNTFQFQKMKTPHPTAAKQSQLYMHFLGLPRAIILVEDKNTQEIKVFIIEYDPEKARPYIERLYKTHEYKDMFLNTGKMVKRKCQNCNTKRAERCNMRDACFNIGIGRVKLDEIK